MYELCGKVRDLEPYEPIKGTYRIRLDANESFYNMPDEIKQEIKDIIDVLPFNRYPDSMVQMKCFIYWRLPCLKETV